MNKAIRNLFLFPMAFPLVNSSTNLHPVLLRTARTRPLVLALGRIELVAQGHGEGAPRVGAHCQGADSAIGRHVVRHGAEQVRHAQQARQAFPGKLPVQRSVQPPLGLVVVHVLAMSLGYYGRVHIHQDVPRQFQAVLPKEAAQRMIEHPAAFGCAPLVPLLLRAFSDTMAKGRC